MILEEPGQNDKVFFGESRSLALYFAGVLIFLRGFRNSDNIKTLKILRRFCHSPGQENSPAAKRKKGVGE